MTAHSPEFLRIDDRAMRLSDLRREAGSVYRLLKMQLEVMRACQVRIDALTQHLGALEAQSVSVHGVLPIEDAAPAPSRLTMAVLAADVAARTGVSVRDMRGQSRLQRFFMARALFCAEAHSAGFSSARIGLFMGGRDHTTILAAIKRKDDAQMYFAGNT